MFKKLKKDIDLELKSFLEEIKKDFSHNSESKLIYTGLKDFIDRDGKRIRPALFLISYLGYSGRKKISYKKLLRASLSLELLHDFFLIHDDVIDRSDLRRGKPTLHRVFNKNLGLSKENKLGSDLGIVAGDILFVKAIEAILSLETEPNAREKTLKLLLEAATATGIGEFLDVVNDIKDVGKIKEKDVILTYTLKTAKYTFEAPLLMGATLAGCDKKEYDKLSRMAIALGGAFQVQDDLLDIYPSTRKTGKPILSDLDESKKTLLVWKTYNSLNVKDKKSFNSIFNKKKKTHKDLLKLKKFILDTSADKYCTLVSKLLINEAVTECEQLKMSKKHKDTLLALADKIIIK